MLSVLFDAVIQVPQCAVLLPK